MTGCLVLGFWLFDPMYRGKEVEEEGGWGGPL
jgi:hypothetical protein